MQGAFFLLSYPKLKIFDASAQVKYDALRRFKQTNKIKAMFLVNFHFLLHTKEEKKKNMDKHHG